MYAEACLRQKLSKKLKLAVGKTNSSKEDRNKNSKSVRENFKYGGRETGASRNLKSSMKDKKMDTSEGSESKAYGKEFEPVNVNGRKNKFRADRESDMGHKSLSKSEYPGKKAVLRKGPSLVRGKGNDRPRSTLVVSKRSEDGATLKGKHSSPRLNSEVRNSAKSSGHKRRTSTKDGEYTEPIKVSSGRNGSLRSNSKTEMHLSSGLDTSQKKFQYLSPSHPAKKIGRDGKSTDDSSELSDDQPKKKKKWGIRIDPYDTSNKRMADDITTGGKTERKKMDPDKKEEMSKNSQFRAIQPSASILSFVQDNVSIMRTAFL